MTKRTPRSAKLPQSSLKSALTVVKALHDLAGPSSVQIVAQEMGVSPAGGRFRTHVTSSKYFGFIEKREGKLALTPRGEKAVGEDTKIAAQAKVEAVMSTAFGNILITLAGRDAKAATLAARLQDDLGVPPSSASTLAETLLKSSEEAGITKNGKFDATAIESMKSLATKPVSPTTRAQNELLDNKPVEAPRNITKPSDAKVPIEELAQASPQQQPVTISLNLDTSSWTPKQVAEFLKELRSQ